MPVNYERWPLAKPAFHEIFQAPDGIRQLSFPNNRADPPNRDHGDEPRLPLATNFATRLSRSLAYLNELIASISSTIQDKNSRLVASMVLPWDHSYKRHADNGEQSVAKRKRVDQPSVGGSTETMRVPGSDLDRPPLGRVWHRRTMAVTNTDQRECLSESTWKPLFPFVSSHRVSLLSRNPSDIEIETRAGYKLATMTNFRNDMSVKEKLFLGLSQSFRKMLEFNAQVENATDSLLSSDRNEISHLELTPCHDLFLGGSYALQHKTVVQDSEPQKRMYGLPDKETMLKETVNKPSYDYREERKRLNKHFLASSRFVNGAHQRLTTVIRPRSNKTHTIPGLAARRRPGQIMNVEWQQEYYGMTASMSFSAFQGRSMEVNGYQKRGIRRLHFRKVDNVYQPFPGPPLVTATAEDYGASFSTEMFFQDGVDGNLSMTELDITDINGRKRRWICIEISRPLVQAIGPVPSELIPMPRSYLKIAAPCEKVLVTTDARELDERLDRSQSPQLGNFKRLTIQGHGRGENANQVRLRMCSDGVPIFATGSKRDMPIANRIDDFLFAKNVVGLPWKETDRRVGNATKAMRKHEFWERCRSAADVDKARWKSLQDAMARDDCVVDITFEGEWDRVEPSVQMPQKVVWTPKMVPQTGLSSFARPLRAKGAEKGRASSSGSRRIGKSGLRNEVQL